ncbi:hypothetical protein EJ06DRAFT_506095 [Trichodelitschia bisporula]|uniref:Integral membrane protein-like protein n=1 Tax=Trichodelitschia bisporula TaxID=703511 RepID=A0A6G1I4J3_9PEZI|nr:hypothetical protein EJ06DRAFT_506095 [Trichodelitschia bisporula]
MGKAGRFACIFVPMALTLASLICIVVIFLGGQNKGDANLRSLWYFKADFTAFKNNITDDRSQIGKLLGNKIGTTALGDALKQAFHDQKLADEYYIYLWNYCTGSHSNGTIGAEKLTYCSPRQSRFAFDPLAVWGLNGTVASSVVPDDVKKGLAAYTKASTWMFVVYVVALIATIVNVFTGVFAIFSRWGSCVTSIAASVASLFTFLAALTSTILFSTLVGTLNTALKDYDIHMTVGTRMLALDWIAFAFSFGAGLFWTISTCCCSGKSDRKSGKSGKKSAAEKGESVGLMPAFGSGSRGYQPLEGNGAHGTPQQGYAMGAMPGGSSPYKGRETAYEPFRHQG